MSPGVVIKSKSTYTIGKIEDGGCIKHIWMTPTGNWRNETIGMYWDDETSLSVEVPVGDFFCMGWNKYAALQSLGVCVNPGSAFNCCPFEKNVKSL